MKNLFRSPFPTLMTVGTLVLSTAAFAQTAAGPPTPSPETEAAMGRRASEELEQHVNLLQDPAVVDYVNRLTQNIARNSSAPVPFTVHVIDSDEIALYALPGSFLYVNSGLIAAADTEAELAGVIAHGIAHVAARHAASQQGRASFLEILGTPASVGGRPGFMIQLAASFGLPVTFVSFGRSDEEEADELGIRYAYDAGYDPSASQRFFERLMGPLKPQVNVSALFSAHAQTPDRLDLARANVARLPARTPAITDTPEFHVVKARVLSLVK